MKKRIIVAIGTRLSRATIDVNNAAELEAVRVQESADATRRAREAVAEMQRLGVLDANGRRIRQDLPSDMRGDSTSDMSSL